MVPKFRGRNIETGEWVYGHLFYFDDGRHFISPTGTDVVGGYGGAPAKYRLENLVCFEIVPETVGQSTGLKDRNGVEIFDGDVVQAEQYLTTTIPVRINGIVKYSDRYTMFYLDNGSERHDLYMQSLGGSIYNFEVIGNIYENPELLEETACL